MAADIITTSTTKLTHPILLTRFIRFALASLNMHLASFCSTQFLASLRTGRQGGVALTQHDPLPAMVVAAFVVGSLETDELVKGQWDVLGPGPGGTWARGPQDL